MARRSIAKHEDRSRAATFVFVVYALWMIFRGGNRLTRFLDELHGCSSMQITGYDGASRTYLRNNRVRMDYPSYRMAGLPIGSELVESLVKEINRRVKGTEKFWNDPSGANPILALKAASLCDDGRLGKLLAG